jgi:hypothetical protein
MPSGGALPAWRRAEHVGDALQPIADLERQALADDGRPPQPPIGQPNHLRSKGWQHGGVSTSPADLSAEFVRTLVVRSLEQREALCGAIANVPACPASLVPHKCVQHQDNGRPTVVSGMPKCASRCGKSKCSRRESSCGDTDRMISSTGSFRMVSSMAS